MSVCKIDTPVVADQEGTPTRGGINDLRMGTVDKNFNCETCKSSFADCCGHFGHIELIKPMYHVGFIEVCRKILRCICFNCSKILALKDGKFKQAMKLKNPQKRQHLMFNICKTIKQCKISNRHEVIIRIYYI
jgi:DNA-directed RNA polymerase II subunit RPB1